MTRISTASRGFVSYSWAFLFLVNNNNNTYVELLSTSMVSITDLQNTLFLWAGGIAPIKYNLASYIQTESFPDLFDNKSVMATPCGKNDIWRQAGNRTK